MHIPQREPQTVQEQIAAWRQNIPNIYHGAYRRVYDRAMSGRSLKAAKNRQTTTARDALRFNMISALTDDPKVMKRYIKATQPEIKKLLPGE